MRITWGALKTTNTRVSPHSNYVRAAGGGAQASVVIKRDSKVQASLKRSDVGNLKEITTPRFKPNRLTQTRVPGLPGVCLLLIDLQVVYCAWDGNL